MFGTYRAGGHVERLGSGVDHMVDRLHRKVEGHEFTDRAQPRLQA